MTRMARVVVPGIAHHVTQRGNRQQTVFLHNGDYRHYLRLLAQYSEQCRLAILAYCLMPNHVHIVAIPERECSLPDAIGKTHRSYALYLHQRMQWNGHLWQGRFSSFPLCDTHLFNAIGYVENNPLRAGLVEYPEEWEWSSAAEGGISSARLVQQDLRAFLLGSRSASAQIAVQDFHKHEQSGRPLGDDAFIAKIEQITGRALLKGKLGPKKQM